MTQVAETISQLPNAPNALTGAEYAPIVQTVSGVPGTYRVLLSQITALISAGVSSINSKTGAITFVSGTNTTVSVVGNNIAINSTGGGGGGISQSTFNIIG